MPDPRGLRLLDRMLIDYGELERIQDEADLRERLGRQGTVHQAGWIAEWIGPTPNLGWRIYDAGSGELAISTIDTSGIALRLDQARPDTTDDVLVLGIDRNGRALEHRTDEVTYHYLRDPTFAKITVPNDGVWYTLVARVVTQQRELGALQITGGAVAVTGNGTQFTRLRDGADPGLPTKIRIAATDTAAGNEGEYVVDTIASDTSMTLTTAPPNSEATCRFRVMGRFRGTVPADPDIHRVAMVEWELVTRTTTRPADGALIAYDVRRSGGTVYLIDRRRGQVFRPYTDLSRPAFGLVPAVRPTGSSSSSLAVTHKAERLQVDPALGYYAVALSMAPAATGSHLTSIAADQPTGHVLAVLYNETSPSTNRHIRVYLRTAASGVNVEWAAGSTVLSAASIRDVAVVAVPVASGGPTHFLFYADSAGDVRYFTSSDNGSSWSGPSALLAGLNVKRLDAILTRMNKLIIVLAPTASPYLRYVWSDDLGGTWNTNGGAATNMNGGPTTNITDVSVVEDDRGNFWTFTAEGAGYVNNPWRAYRGQGEGNPVVNNAEQSAGYFVGPDAGAVFAPSTIEAIAHPSGMIALLGDALDSGTSVSSLVSSVIARNRPLSVEFLVYESTCGLGASDPTPMTAGVDAAGGLHVAWCTCESAGDPLWLRIGRWHPVERSRPDLWHGGE